MIPRIMIAAPKSGSGKTLLTCALLGALKQRNRKVISFKCGPDYIDPMFHRTVLGVPAENLDTWFSGEEGTRQQFCEAAAGSDIAVLEGVMGLFDGLGGLREEGSAYHLAKATKTPVLLAADVRGMGGVSMAAMLKGFLEYDREHLVRGIFLNRISEGFFQTVRPYLEAELKVPVVGFFPNRADLRIESRHLGLQLPEEIAGLKEQLSAAAAQLELTENVEKILEIAREAEPLYSKEPGEPTAESLDREKERVKTTGTQPAIVRNGMKHETPLTLAVARDEAFCFYYAANLRLLEKLGVAIRTFSPLHDPQLPENIDGLLLGGGYPELYARQLSENESMRASIREAIESGLPSLAECGGFLYLHAALSDPEGKAWPMAGVLPASAKNTGKPVRFGYAEIREKTPVFLPAGKAVKAHEFHYYDSTDNGSACTAVKPTTGRSWDCMHAAANHFWGFAHLYYPSAPEFARYFVGKMNESRGQVP